MVKAEEKDTYRFKAIIGSIPEVGLVEPLVLYPQKDAPGKYMLKNGHPRYFALKDLGKSEANCLIARMESEMESLERDLIALTDNYTENMFTLQTALTYIKNLLKNAKVVRYLNANHTEIYSEFETIAAAETV